MVSRGCCCWEEIKEDVVNVNYPLFPELKGLELSYLPLLKHICKYWVSSTNHWFSSSSSPTAAPPPPVPSMIIFPQLNKMAPKCLPSLTSFCPRNHSVQRHDNADLDSPLFDQMVSILSHINISFSFSLLLFLYFP